jgi:hypothetical protein
MKEAIWQMEDHSPGLGWSRSTVEVWTTYPNSALPSPSTPLRKRHHTDRCTYISNLWPLPTSTMMMMAQQTSRKLGFSSTMMWLIDQEDFNVNIL